MKFELTVHFCTTVFKTVALILSATSPWSQRMESNHFRHGPNSMLFYSAILGAGARVELALDELMRLVSLPFGLPRHRGGSMLHVPFICIE